MTEDKRQGDGKYFNVPPRMSRILRIRERWYFLTREQARCGPYDTKIEAEQALSDFLSSVKDKPRDKLLA